MRVGNRAYAEANGSFGLSTLKDRHVKKESNGTWLKFKGKSGKNHNVGLHSVRLARLVMRCKELPGQTLFQYEGDDGEVHAVDSGMVNDYLREATGGEFTSKDLRTWQGSVCFVESMLDTDPAKTKTARRSQVVEAVDEVARHLGNTRAVCRAHYVHPTAIARGEAGTLHDLADGIRESRSAHALSLAEKILMRLCKAR
jgi:DNA topoisomerase-1